MNLEALTNKELGCIIKYANLFMATAILSAEYGYIVQLRADALHPIRHFLVID